MGQGMVGQGPLRRSHQQDWNDGVQGKWKPRRPKGGYLLLKQRIKGRGGGGREKEGKKWEKGVNR